NAWARRFLQFAFGDELGTMGQGISDFVTSRTGLGVFENTLMTHGALCDEMATNGIVETCQLEALKALDDAFTYLASPAGFNSSDWLSWRWGLKHTLTLASQLPSTALNIPPPDDPNVALRHGYPRHGDQFDVDASNPGLHGTTYTYGSGPSMRHL